MLEIYKNTEGDFEKIFVDGQELFFLEDESCVLPRALAGKVTLEDLS